MYIELQKYLILESHEIIVSFILDIMKCKFPFPTKEQQIFVSLVIKLA